MSNPVANTKQSQRAQEIVSAAVALRQGLAALASIAYDASLDGVTLTGVDVSAVNLPLPPPPAAQAGTLAYIGTSGAPLDQLVAILPQLQALVGSTNATGTATPLAQVIAAVCPS